MSESLENVQCFFALITNQQMLNPSQYVEQEMGVHLGAEIALLGNAHGFSHFNVLPDDGNPILQEPPLCLLLMQFLKELFVFFAFWSSHEQSTPDGRHVAQSDHRRMHRPRNPPTGGQQNRGQPCPANRYKRHHLALPASSTSRKQDSRSQKQLCRHHQQPTPIPRNLVRHSTNVVQEGCCASKTLSTRRLGS